MSTVPEGVEVRGYTVRAKMYVPAVKYSNDFYLVKILEPKGLDTSNLNAVGKWNAESLRLIL